MSNRVALAVSPPMLADMLVRLLGRRGIEVVGVEGEADVVVIIGTDPSDSSAEVTIIISDDGTSAPRATVKRKDRFDTVPISSPSDVVDLIAAV